MGNVIRFKNGDSRPGTASTRTILTVRDVSRQFGLEEWRIRRWTREGLIRSEPYAGKQKWRFDARALDVFYRVRDLRGRGLSFRQIEAELQGQLNLFPNVEADVVPLPRRTSAFQEALRLHERDDPEAIDWYLKAAAEGDHVADAFCNLGILHYQAGKVSEAFDCFSQGLAADPRHFESHFNLAHMYFECGDLKLARLHYELAASIDASFADLYYNLGLVHALDGALSKAMAALYQARELVQEDGKKRVDDLLSTIRDVLKKPPSGTE